MGISVRPFLASEWRTYRDLRLRALAESPDAFGGTYEVDAARPDSEWEHRLELGIRSPLDLPLLALDGDVPAGLAWSRLDQGVEVADLYQMWVAPGSRRLGIGALLLDAAIGWARDLSLHAIALRVTTGNSAAMRLYSRAGFSPTKDPEPLRPGSPLETERMVLELGD